MASAKIQKTIARQREKIAEGQFYEAHQQLRVIAARYIKSTSYDTAIDLLSSGALLLLQAHQGGSGGDLCLLLMEVYHKAGAVPDPASKGRLFTLLRAFPEAEPTRKRFVNELVSWSTTPSTPFGDPEIHHVAGSLALQSGNALDAERHLLLGTRDSIPFLAKLEASWYGADDASTAPHFASRGVLPLLRLGNARAAKQFLLLFSATALSNSAAGAQTVAQGQTEVRVYPALPLLNFLSLLVLACQKGAPELFRLLRGHYQHEIAEEESWDEVLNEIGEMWFGIAKPRQSNPLMDMLGGMFGGSGGGPRSLPGGPSGPLVAGLD